MPFSLLCNVEKPYIPPYGNASIGYLIDIIVGVICRFAKSMI